MNLYEASLSQDSSDEILLTMDEYDSTKASLLEIIERADQARRLSEHEDFKNLFMVGYFTEEPHRLSDLMASGKLPEQVFNSCVEQLKAIGHVRQFLKTLIEQGNMAQDDLKALDEARDYALENGGFDVD